MSCPIPFPPAIDPFVSDGLTAALGSNYQDQITDAITYAKTKYKVSEFDDWNITTGEDFALFASGMLKWIPSENAPGRTIYDVLCMFYFVLDQPPVDTYQTEISPNSLNSDYSVKMTALSTWIVNFAKEVGTFMATSDSLTAASYQSFWDSPLFHMEEALVPNKDDSRGGFTCFNDLFARKLQQGMRPISCPDDDRVIVYPADSTFDGAWPVQQSGSVKLDTYDIQKQVMVKGVPWPIAALLQGSKYAGLFEDGVWMHAFLGPTDYHRQHAPVSGTVLEAQVIDGLAYLNVIPEKDPRDNKIHLRPHRNDDSNGQYLPGAPDDPGYQFIQVRGCVIIENDTVGHVAVLPIGMAQVSSVVLNPDIIPQTGKAAPTVTKGQEISHFEFGGSDIVLVFEPKAKVLILGNTTIDTTTDMVTKGQKYLVGEPLGIAGLGPQKWTSTT